MATIAQIAIRMEAQYAQMQKGLGTMRKEMKQTGEEGSGMGKLLKVAFAGAAIALAANTVKNWTEDTIKATTQSYRLSSTLGITTTSLQQLQFAGREAGVETEEFNGVLDHLVKNLGEAAEGTGPAADALAKINLTGKDLAGLHTDEVFKKIAQAISQVKDPTVQARVATELFGKEGQKLLTLFQEGAEGIDAAAAKALKFGVAMNEVDAAKLVDANAKFKDVEETVTGLENQLTIALAPTLSDIADRVTAITPGADGMRSAFTSALRAVGVGIGYTIDGFHLLQAGTALVCQGIVAAFEGVIWILAKTADGIIWVSNKVFNTNLKRPEWITGTLEYVDQWRKAIGDQVDNAWNQPSAVDKVNGFFDNIQKKADETAKKMVAHKADMAKPLSDAFGEAGKKAQSILDAMQKEVSDFGLTDAQKKLNDLQDAGGSPAQLKRGQELADIHDRQEALKKMQDESKKLTEDSLTPLQKYSQEVAHINDLKARGLITDQVAHAQQMKLAAEVDKGEDKKVSAETRRFDFKGRATGPQKADPIQQLAQIQKGQAKDVKDSVWFLSELYRFGQNKDQNPDEVVDF